MSNTPEIKTVVLNQEIRTSTPPQRIPKGTKLDVFWGEGTNYKTVAKIEGYVLDSVYNDEITPVPEA